MIKLKDFIFIVVPINSTDYDIDDTFGNVLQYKINGQWQYDTQSKLPISSLKVIGVVENRLILKFGLNPKNKWIVMRSY